MDSLLKLLSGSLTSRTMWAALAAAVLPHVSVITEFVTAHVSGTWAVTLLAGVFDVLRMVTSSSLADKTAPKP